MELENLQEHIQKLTHEEWDKLFSLIPQIESQTEFGEDNFGEILPNGSPNIIHAWDPSPVVMQFVYTADSLGLVPVYDWPSWEEGRQLLQDDTSSYDHLDTVSLIKLFTMMIRADRFSDGFLVLSFENGSVLKILKALKSKVLEKQE